MNIVCKRSNRNENDAKENHFRQTVSYVILTCEHELFLKLFINVSSPTLCFNENVRLCSLL